MTSSNKWTLVFDEYNSPKLVGVSLNDVPLAVKSISFEQGVGQLPMLKLEVFIHNDTLETTYSPEGVSQWQRRSLTPPHL